VATAAQIGARLRAEAAREIKAIALDIDRELRRATPIDTGHARRNWIPSVGQPHTTEAASDAERVQGIAQALAYSLEAGPLWLSNVVAYINRLNYGHSKQAPAGFIERAVDLALQRAQARGSKHIDVSALRASYQDEVGSRGAENLASAYSPFGGDE